MARDDLTAEERDVLRRLAATRRIVLCPRCARREVPTRSKTGWCGSCTDDEQRRAALRKARQERWLAKRRTP